MSKAKVTRQEQIDSLKLMGEVSEHKRAGVDAVVYTVNLSAKSFIGKSEKCANFFRFKTIAQRDLWMERFFVDTKYTQDQNRKRAEEIAQPCKIVAGDVLCGSFGYEQTAHTFYEVLAVKNNFATLRQLRTTEFFTGDMTSRVAPVMGEYVSDETLRRKIFCGDTVKVKSYEFASKWDGRSKADTHYG